MYFALLALPLSEVINDSLTLGTIPPSWTETSIVVPKKERNPSDVRSYWPISLLNLDYKIFTALLTKRLNKIIVFYIHLDQSGFMPNKDLTDNVYRMLELIHFGRTTPGCSSISLV